LMFLRKEVIQPQVPLRLPCYDFIPVTTRSLGLRNKSRMQFGSGRLPWCDGRCVQGPGTYSRRRSWYGITSDSSFMQASCSLQSELSPVFWDFLTVAGLAPSVLGIVVRVQPWA